MNKLHEILQQTETIEEQITKTFKKIFGIPPELENYNGTTTFHSHGETFAIDHEQNLLWHLNNQWNTIKNLEEAKQLWNN